MAATSLVPSAAKPVDKSTNLSPQDAERIQKQLDTAIDTAFSGGLAKEKANQARQRAADATSKAERAKYEQEAKDYDADAQNQLRTSKRMQSGAWQGLGAGAATGAGTGIALGGVVGTLTGGVLAVPLTAVGGLVGAGAGVVHGPWIKLTRTGKGPSLAPAEEGEPGAIQIKPGEVDSLSKGAEEAVDGVKPKSSQIRNKPKPGRSRPKKLESRSAD